MSAADFETRMYNALSSSYGVDRALLAYLRKERLRVAEELDSKLKDDLNSLDAAIAYEVEQSEACRVRITEDMQKRHEAEQVYERECVFLPYCSMHGSANTTHSNKSATGLIVLQQDPFGRSPSNSATKVWLSSTRASKMPTWRPLRMHSSHLGAPVSETRLCLHTEQELTNTLHDSTASLRLHDNSITDKGCKMLAPLLANNTLRHLDLSSNRISAKALSTVLKLGRCVQRLSRFAIVH